MINLKTLYTHQVTVWTYSGRDGFGKPIFNSPVIYSGFWEEKAEKFLNETGEELVSKAVVYIDGDVPIGSYAALGDYTSQSDPTTISGSYQIVESFKIARIRGSKEWLRKYMLR